MPLFSYIAMKDKRQEVKGELDAATQSEAVTKLRGMGLFVVRIELGKMKNGSPWGAFLTTATMLLPSYWKPAKKDAYVQLYRQLSLMLTSGHTLLESLELCATLAERKHLTRTLQTARKDIQRGSSFSQSLDKFPKQFAPQVVELVKSAEASGELDQVLMRLADDSERIQDMKRQLITALIYPCIVLVMTIGLLILMAVSVLPKMESFISRRDVPLPPSTQMMMNASDFIVLYGLHMSIISGLIIFSILASYTTPTGKRIIDRIFLSMPVIGPTIIAATMAQTGWTISMLSASGVTLLDSLKISAKITSNVPLKSRFEDAAVKVLNGTSLTVALQQKHIPDLFHKMAAVGEKSGELDRVMYEVGQYFNTELQAKLKRMLAMIEPMLLLMVAGPVGFVYLSIFQLIFAASTGGK